MIVLLFAACGKTTDCGDPIFKSLFIKITNAAGENLIEQGEIVGDNIIVRNGMTEYTNVVLSTVEPIKNYITLNLNGPTTDVTYEIQLSETRTDILVLGLSNVISDGICPISFWLVDSASYNGEDLLIEDFNEDFLVTVVLE